MKKNVRLNDEQKALILKKNIEEGVPVSDLADQYGFHPNAFYQWRKKLYDGVSEAGKIKNAEKALSASERKIKELEAKLSQRDSIITELVMDNISLKKKFGENLDKNGLNLKLGTK